VGGEKGGIARSGPQLAPSTIDRAHRKRDDLRDQLRCTIHPAGYAAFPRKSLNAFSNRIVASKSKVSPVYLHW
jgi:hypothetical protein